MKDLCALVLSLKPQGCASPASVAVLDTATHTEKQHTSSLANICAHTHTKHMQYSLSSLHACMSLILAFPAEYTVQAYWVRSIQADIRMNTKPCDVCLCFDVK